MNVGTHAIDKAGERPATDAASREARRNEARESEARVATDAGSAALLTAAQLAGRWQVPVRTIYAWAKRNVIPHYRAGRLLRFDPDEVEEHFRHHGFADEVAADPERPGESAFALLREVPQPVPTTRLQAEGPTRGPSPASAKGRLPRRCVRV